MLRSMKPKHWQNIAYYSQSSLTERNHTVRYLLNGFSKSTWTSSKHLQIEIYSKYSDFVADILYWELILEFDRFKKFKRPFLSAPNCK